ncbi:MAG: isochorismatase family cysteine hydrolase [Pseudomonadota bacterium]
MVGTRTGDVALVALHYQNENCHPDGKIRVGIPAEAEWRWERLGAARRLFAGARAAGVPLVHVRLAVPPDYRGVVANTDHIREWMALGAWREGTWGTKFMEGLGPQGEEVVVTHQRNSGFHGCALADVLWRLGARRLIVCGVSTAYAVEGTVRQAADMGFEVSVAADACATAQPEQHENALAAMAPLARVANADALLAELGA